MNLKTSVVCYITYIWTIRTNAALSTFISKWFLVSLFDAPLGGGVSIEVHRPIYVCANLAHTRKNISNPAYDVREKHNERMSKLTFRHSFT